MLRLSILPAHAANSPLMFRGQNPVYKNFLSKREALHAREIAKIRVYGDRARFPNLSQSAFSYKKSGC